MMRGIFLTLLLVCGSAQAGFAPRVPTDLPCASDTRPIELQTRGGRSTTEFLAVREKSGCNTNTMVEVLYAYSGRETPATASLFDARIHQPPVELVLTKQAHEAAPNDITRAVEYGWNLLRAGQTDQAIGVLEAVYEHATPPFQMTADPQAHTVAELLSLAYEVKGNLPQAVEWAERSYSLSPSPTAWLQLQSLEAQQLHPRAWLAEHSLLGLPFAKGFVVERIELPEVDGRRLTLPQTIDAAAAFLYQRVQLFPNDAVNANVLFDLGHLIGLTGAFEDAQ